MSFLYDTKQNILTGTYYKFIWSTVGAIMQCRVCQFNNIATTCLWYLYMNIRLILLPPTWEVPFIICHIRRNPQCSCKFGQYQLENFHHFFLHHVLIQPDSLSLQLGIINQHLPIGTITFMHTNCRGMQLAFIWIVTHFSLSSLILHNLLPDFSYF